MASELEARIKDAHFCFQRLLEQGRDHWAVMCSGGKDSTAVAALALLFSAKLPDHRPRLVFVHIDTGVENPAVLDAWKTFADSAKRFADSHTLSLSVADLLPPPDQRFFAHLLAKGLPPPNPKFRWCTRAMKLRPVAHYLREALPAHKTAVLVGLRYGESDARDARLNTSCSRGAECGHGSILAKSSELSFKVVSPIASWRTCDVWDFLNLEAPSAGLQTAHLYQLYKDADLARFGCWTCTLIARDNSMLNLISKPQYAHLAPLLWFRERLARLQHDPAAQNHDSSGKRIGLTLAVRRSLFAELTLLERIMGMEILSKEERALIERALSSETHDQKREYSHVIS